MDLPDARASGNNCLNLAFENHSINLIIVSLYHVIPIGIATKVGLVDDFFVEYIFFGKTWKLKLLNEIRSRSLITED